MSTTNEHSLEFEIKFYFEALCNLPRIASLPSTPAWIIRSAKPSGVAACVVDVEDEPAALEAGSSMLIAITPVLSIRIHKSSRISTSAVARLARSLSENSNAILNCDNAVAVCVMAAQEHITCPDDDETAD